MTNFSELYNKYVDILFTYGCKMTSDRELVKDCIHDVFVKYITNYEEGKVKNEGYYLVTALRNRINDEFRRFTRMSDADTSVKHMIVDTNEEFLFERLETETRIQKQLMDKIAKLTPRQQKVIHLYYIEQRNYEEICTIMGINYQSARNIIYRSLTSLRKMAVS